MSQQPKPHPQAQTQPQMQTQVAAGGLPNQYQQLQGPGQKQVYPSGGNGSTNSNVVGNNIQNPNSVDHASAILPPPSNNNNNHFRSHCRPWKILGRYTSSDLYLCNSHELLYWLLGRDFEWVRKGNILTWWTWFSFKLKVCSGIIYILGKCFLNFESIFDFDSIFDLDLIFDLDFPSKREDGYVQWI